MEDNKENNNNSDREKILEKITRKECGCRRCKCGKEDCEFAADFFGCDGNPTAQFGEDADLIEEQQLEAALDYSDYAERTGITENGESVYRNTAEYRMIDPSGESADASKS